MSIKAYRFTGDHSVVTVSKLPDCDFCGNEAHFDGATTVGPWANMCGHCFQLHGKGLGLGIGQLLVTHTVFPDATGENVPFAGEY